MKTHSTNPRLFILTLALNWAILQTACADAWLANGSMTKSRYVHTATLLPNGKVLVTGGFSAVTATAELYDPATGGWRATGSLSTPRAGHTATLLPDGRVLVVAGQGANYSYLSSVELYNPATGAWTNASPLSTKREYPTATLLPNGKVLVAGGIGEGNVSLASVELYDPATGTWRATGPMAVPRKYHAATLLPNGKVLVTGGHNNPTTVLRSAELYDPATETWTSTGAMRTARFDHTATLLPNGKVLAAGGLDTDYIATAELYDPATGTWTSTGALRTARRYGTASLLPNGKVLVTGGQGLAGAFLSSAELYDPLSGAWTATASMAAGRFVASATLLANGKVMVAGGYNSSGVSASTELYDSANGTWSNTGVLPNARFHHTASLLPNGTVLVAGGVGTGGFLANAALYAPATGTWTTTGSLITSRADHTATLLADGKVLVAGGYGGSPTWPLRSAELFDPVTGAWTPTGPLTTTREQHTAILLADGKLLVAGGWDSIAGTALSTAELYDPARGTWTPTGALLTRRLVHTLTLLPNGKVLAAGGFNETGSFLASAELYDPATGTWTATGLLNRARDHHTATLLPNGKVLIAGGWGTDSGHAHTTAELFDPAAGTWTLTGPMATARAQHTATLLPNGLVLLAGGHDYNRALWQDIFVSSAELYDPATGTCRPAPGLTTARYGHTANLLPSGQVLLAAGLGPGNAYLSSVELYDAGLGFSPVWQPLISAATSPLPPGQSVLITGSGFRGLSGASCGNAQDSSTDYPVIQLRSVESGQTIFLMPANWTATSFASQPLPPFPLGYAFLTAFVNGIPSPARIINIDLINAPPVARCRDVTRLADANCQATVTPAEVDNGSSDPDADPVTLRLDPAGPFSLGTTPVALIVTDDHGHTNTCFATVTVNDAQPPTVLCSVSRTELWPPNHNLANVGLSASATDNCHSEPLPLSVRVFSNQDDIGSSVNGAFSPDAANIAPGTLSLRQERQPNSPGRVYLILVTATDASGNLGLNCCTVCVPASHSAAAISAVNAQAAAVSAYTLSHGGAIPPGYFVIGDGPVIGPARKLSDGSFGFVFQGHPGAAFEVLTTTNLSLPLTDWTVLGRPAEIAPGRFQFGDPQAANLPRRFYHLRSR